MAAKHWCPPALSQAGFDNMVASMSHKHGGSDKEVKTRRGKSVQVHIPALVDAQLHAFEFACVDQETIVLYDPRRLAVGQASPKQASFSLAKLGQQGAPQLTNPTATVYGYARDRRNAHHEIPVRLASPGEVSALRSPFSRCTTPLVFQTIWSHNLGEFLSRAPPAFERAARTVQGSAAKAFKHLSVVIASPDKIPVPAFSVALLQPFTSLKPSSFADFSSRLPEDTPSNSTHEGRHLRCFERLLVWREVRDNRNQIPALGKTYRAYYAPQLAQLDATEVLPWRDESPSTLRVLIERRRSYGRVGERQFLQLDNLLAACNAQGATSGGGSARGGAQGGTRGGARGGVGGCNSTERAGGVRPQGGVLVRRLARRVPRGGSRRATSRRVGGPPSSACRGSLGSTRRAWCTTCG
eukprot:scaffold93319_cov63-Phaeocystis_antarctica.AAC.3